MSTHRWSCPIDWSVLHPPRHFLSLPENPLIFRYFVRYLCAQSEDTSVPSRGVTLGSALILRDSQGERIGGRRRKKKMPDRRVRRVVDVHTPMVLSDHCGFTPLPCQYFLSLPENPLIFRYFVRYFCADREHSPPPHRGRGAFTVHVAPLQVQKGLQ